MHNQDEQEGVPLPCLWLSFYSQFSYRFFSKSLAPPFCCLFLFSDGTEYVSLLQITSFHVVGLLILHRPPFLLSLLSHFSCCGLVLLVLSSWLGSPSSVVTGQIYCKLLSFCLPSERVELLLMRYLRILWGQRASWLLLPLRSEQCVQLTDATFFITPCVCPSCPDVR
jgi:hypothetical protein